jgi:O-methyltransferase
MLFIIVMEAFVRLVHSAAESRLLRPTGATPTRQHCMISTTGLVLARRKRFDPQMRSVGRDWPPFAHAMTGLARLQNVQDCIEDVLANNVPGDLIETGVWRGGTCILMRGVLKAHGATDRTVWVADSFAGLPPPDSRYPADAGDAHHKYDALAVSLEEVKRNFAQYGLLDEQVRFLKGWFADTLPSAPIERIAVLRLDGDMYGSTMDAISALYPKLSIGGWCIVDDYLNIPGCRQAIDDYRSTHGIHEPLQTVDWTAVCWKRLS